MPIFTLESLLTKDQDLAQCIVNELEPSTEFEENLLMDGINDLIKMDYTPHPKLMENILKQIKSN